MSDSVALLCPRNRCWSTITWSDRHRMRPCDKTGPNIVSCKHLACNSGCKKGRGEARSKNISTKAIRRSGVITTEMVHRLVNQLAYIANELEWGHDLISPCYTNSPHTTYALACRTNDRECQLLRH